MLILLPLLATLGALAVFYVLGKPRYLAKVKGAGAEESSWKISIIIPARDEANNIPELLASLSSERELVHEIIVVDDGSTDGTAELARKAGACVVHPDSLADGWNGKPWACQQGADAASADCLLFLDADVRVHPGALSQLHQLLGSGDSNTVYSIYPHHTIRRPYEELSAYFNSLMVAGINAFGFSTAVGTNSALFGQALLIPKSIYQKAGGHAAVKDKVLENFYLAEIIKSQHARCHCLLGKGLVSMRMFPEGFLELWSSWKKGFVSGAANVDGTALCFSSIWITAGMLSIVSLCFLGSSYAPEHYPLYVLVGYLANALSCMWAFRIAGTFCRLTAIFFPIALIFYQCLFLCALISKMRGKQTNWKGRMVH